MSSPPRGGLLGRAVPLGGVEGGVSGSPSGNNAGNSTQLEFNQAMTDFKVMFPAMDADVIEAVLRANNGAVDATIDNLLAMSADNDLDLESSGGDQPPSYKQATEEDEDLINLEGAAASLQPASSEGHAPQHAYSHPDRQKAEDELAELKSSNCNFDDAFLDAAKMRPDAAAKTQQYLEDERIALMLQNEEFMAELQRDSEFMSALDPDPADKDEEKKHLDSDEFRDKLKNMGKSSKRKFAQLAAMFSRRKGAAKQLLGHAPAPSKDNLLLNAEPLVNEEDSESEEQESDKKTPTKGKYTSFS